MVYIRGLHIDHAIVVVIAANQIQKGEHMKRLLVLLYLLRQGKSLSCAIDGSSLLLGIAWYKDIPLTYKALFQSLKGKR